MCKGKESKRIGLTLSINRSFGAKAEEFNLNSEKLDSIEKILKDISKEIDYKLTDTQKTSNFTSIYYKLNSNIKEEFPTFVKEILNTIFIVKKIGEDLPDFDLKDDLIEILEKFKRGELIE